MGKTRTVADNWNQTSKEISNAPFKAMRVINSDGIGSEAITVPAGDLSASAFTFTTTETTDWKIDYVYILFSTPVTETITLTKTTAGVNEVLLVENVVAATTVRLVANQNIVIKSSATEQLKIDITDNGGVGTVATVLKKVGI